MEQLDDLFGMPILIENVGYLYPVNIYEFSKNTDLFNILSVTVNTLLLQISDTEIEKKEQLKQTVKSFDVVISNDSLRETLENLLSLCFHVKRENVKYFPLNGTSLITLSWNDELYKEFEFLTKLAQNIHNEKRIKKIVNRKTEIIKQLLEKTIYRDNYDMIRDKIYYINGLQKPKETGSQQIAEALKREERFNKSNSSQTSLRAIIGAIVANGHDPNKIKNWTLGQINNAIEAINNREDFRAKIQYICAGATDVKLDSFLKSSKLENKETLGENFDKWANKIQKGLS